MEYKDTVIDIGEDKYDGLGAVDLVEAQAEISFKAGKKEVVDWIEGHFMTKDRSEWLYITTGRIELWQSQLKKWGLKKRKGREHYVRSWADSKAKSMGFARQ